MTTRILLVDDDPTILDAFPVYFSTTDDLEVSGTARTGKSALTWLESNICDLVLSDVRMPDIDGIELLQYVQQLSHPPLFVAMTAFDNDETMLKCLSLGAAGYIVKGQDPESIIRSLAERSPTGTILSPESTTRLIKRSVLRPQSHIPPQPLSLEQRTIIRYIQSGMTNHQIARKLKYAEVTIKKKVSTLLSLYGFRSRSELAALAIYDL